jgi:ribose transport system permease protein
MQQGGGLEHAVTPAIGRNVRPPDTVRHLLRRLQPFIGLLVVLILAAVFSPTRDGANLFLDPRNLLNVVRFASENGVIAIGMTLVILTAGIDLSVGALLALCAVGTAACLTRYELGGFPTVLLILLLGGLLGTVNGTVTTRLRIPSFIATLAMLSVARGAASLWSGGYAIPLAFGTGAGQASPAFKSFFAGEVNLLGLAVPAPVFIFLATGILASQALYHTVFGRYVYAVGGNEAAAGYAGVPVDRVKVWVFTLSGMCAGLAALMHTALVNQGSHIDGNGYELNAIAAVVIGGTSLSGGTGTVLGSMVGALILSVLDNILGLRNIPSEYQAILKGAIIVLAVVLQRQRRH